MQLLLGLKYIFIAVVWTILITVLSLITIEKTPSFVLQLPFKDKIVHFVFYFVFGILWSLGLKDKLARFRFKVLFLAIIYGIVIEVLQEVLTKNRTADFYDVLANTLGAVFAFFGYPFFENIFLRSENKK